LVPDIAATLAPGLRVTRHLEDALRGSDVVMLLRVQKERLSGLKIDLADYIARYQMTLTRLKMAKKDAIVMHPGPIIRGLELTSEVADGVLSRILEEVKNGVPTRMAILARAVGKMR
jgi:aspartate carbamoyltransferase catalytic subunit